ncbi:pilus assembly FimT family protein [Myxosarcina sp. GI1(2024)]
MSFCPVSKQNTGFTLIEMLVTVIVVGIIAIAAPSFLGLLNRNRINSA